MGRGVGCRLAGIRRGGRSELVKYLDLEPRSCSWSLVDVDVAFLPLLRQRGQSSINTNDIGDSGGINRSTSIPYRGAGHFPCGFPS